MALVTDSEVELRKLRIETVFEHGVDIQERTVQLVGKVNIKMFRFLDAAMSILESDSRKGIVIKINSEGGNTYDAIAIVSRIRNSTCKVQTEGYGAVMSAALLILACGHKRRISEYSWAMWHEVGYEVSGKHTEVVHFTKQTEREEYMWCEAMGKFTKMHKDFWNSIGKDKDFYIEANKCLQYGIVDEVF